MRVNKGSLTYHLLYALEKTVDGLVLLDDFTYNFWKYTDGPNLDPNGLKKSSVSEAIRRLREKGYIEKELSEGKTILKLTRLGNEFLSERKDTEWDGKYRIVIWDIPEKNRRVRDLFRRRLKQWGFAQWQGSVWVSKKNVTGKLRKLISQLDMNGLIAVIESDDPTLSHIIFHGR